MGNFWTKTNVAMSILVLVAVTSLGLVAYLVIAGRDIPAVVLTLLSVVVGFLGTTLGSAQGAEQALTPPPPLTDKEQNDVASR